MIYKLTLTNELGEVLDYWAIAHDGSEFPKEGTVFDLDEDDDGMYLIDEIKGAVGRSEHADHEQKLEKKREMEDDNKS